MRSFVTYLIPRQQACDTTCACLFARDRCLPQAAQILHGSTHLALLGIIRRPVKAASLDSFRANPKSRAIEKQYLQPILLRVGKQKHMAAHRVAQQLIAHQAIQAIEAFAHIRSARRKVDARRRAQAEHALRPIQQTHQTLQRGCIKPAPHCDPPPVGELQPQMTARFVPACRNCRVIVQ